MNEKRTKQLNVRITEKTESILIKEANKLKWSKAQLAEEILRNWTDKAERNETGINQFIIETNNTINIY